jgi:hypothetical protein
MEEPTMRSTLQSAVTTAVLVAVLTQPWAGVASGQNPAQATQTDARGGITVKAVYLTPAYFKASPGDPLAGKVDLERHLVIAITFEAHSGDLSRYDVVKNALLRTDQGQQVAPVGWVPTTDGAHHRAGGLLFPRADPAGRTIDARAKVLELVLRGLGGVTERTMRWTLSVR